MYKALSLLLIYPTQEWQQELPAIYHYIENLSPQKAEKLKPLLTYLEENSLITIQENYVTIFDRNNRHSLHLFEHLYGEDRERGQAMVDLLQEYQAVGLEPDEQELPDYLPLFMEFLAQIDSQKAAELLGDAIHVIGYIADNLKESESLYALVLESLIELSPIKLEPLKVAPVRDMDEAMEMFGPSSEGIEPLLKPSCPYLGTANSTLKSDVTINLNEIKHQPTIRG